MRAGVVPRLDTRGHGAAQRIISVLLEILDSQPASLSQQSQHRLQLSWAQCRKIDEASITPRATPQQQSSQLSETLKKGRPTGRRPPHPW